jgi:hypothetical protein
MFLLFCDLDVFLLLLLFFFFLLVVIVLWNSLMPS